MSTITLKLTKAESSRLYETFREYGSDAPAYADWQIRPEGCVITCYTSGKVVFQGKDAEVYASPFACLTMLAVLSSPVNQTERITLE